MKILKLVTVLLIIVGGLNWGLMAWAQTDLVATLFGGPATLLSRFVYLLMGISALYPLVSFSRATASDEVIPQPSLISTMPGILFLER